MLNRFIDGFLYSPISFAYLFRVLRSCLSDYCSLYISFGGSNVKISSKPKTKRMTFFFGRGPEGGVNGFLVRIVRIS